MVGAGRLRFCGHYCRPGEGARVKILWFPRLQYDVDRLHLVTWLEMARELERRGHEVHVAVAGLGARRRPAGSGCRCCASRACGCRSSRWPPGRSSRGTTRSGVPTWWCWTCTRRGWALPFARGRRRARWIVDNRSPIAHTSLPRGRRGGAAGGAHGGGLRAGAAPVRRHDHDPGGLSRPGGANLRRTSFSSYC